MSVLVFSDAHDKPGTDQLRFTALGNLIAHSRPDVIMQLGDFMTMDSLSRWNVNKRLTMEGVRYKKDVQSARAAIHKMWLPVYNLQCSQRESKKAVYRPQVYWFEGNHECWVSAYLEQHPEMVGHIQLREDLKLPQDWIWVPYPQHVLLDNIYYCHAPQNKTGAISSKYIADRVFEYYGKTTVFGHTHRRLISSSYRYGVERTDSINTGCFFEEDPDYAQGHPNDYWKGVMMIEDGDVTEMITLERLKRLWL
jgi:predicted phosphodiesterase